MKCSEFLECLESASFWQRLQARRHARHCPQCAAAQRAWRELTSDLAQHEPLTPHQRRLWEQAAVDETATEPAFAPYRWRLVFAASLAVTLLVAALVISRFGERDEVVLVPQSPDTTLSSVVVKPIDTRTELTNLEAKIAALEIELAEVSRKAELADARKEVVTLIATYSKW